MNDPSRIGLQSEIPDLPSQVPDPSEPSRRSPDAEPRPPCPPASSRELAPTPPASQGLRDRLTSGPKTLAARKLALRDSANEARRSQEGAQDEKLTVKKFEHEAQIQSHQSQERRSPGEAIEGNTRQEERRIQGDPEISLPSNKSHIDKIEGEILEAMERVDAKASR